MVGCEQWRQRVCALGTTLGAPLCVPVGVGDLVVVSKVTLGPCFQLTRRLGRRSERAQGKMQHRHCTVASRCARSEAKEVSCADAIVLR